MTIRSILTTAAVTALLATPVLGQQHEHPQEPVAEAGMDGHGMMSHQEMMRGGMMGMMQAAHPGPGMLLAASDQLGLTAQQIEQLTALSEESFADHQAHMAATMTAHTEAAAALGAEDVDAYAAALGKAADHMVMMQVIKTRAALSARESLTPEQQSRLEGAMSMMRHMMGNGMMGSSRMMKSGGMTPSGGVTPGA